MKCSLFKTIEKRKRTMMTPRVAAIHDMSGFGRCSLTVAIPILSAMGVQCCPLPTAFLSTHTGGFEGFTFLDMTDEMSKVADHWASLGLTFQAVYSGFLGGRRSVVLTGASLAPGRTGAVCFDARTGKTEAVQTAYVAHEFHGTGDVFSSVLTGALVRGESLSSAAGEAAAFVRACAERTAAEDLPMREGVDFEPLLGLLIPGKETV